MVRILLNIVGFNNSPVTGALPDTSATEPALVLFKSSIAFIKVFT
ncbi:MAG: hypothetical protein ACI4VL_05720 [Bacilli bacterium]